MTYREEVILETDEVRVRILALEAGETTAWHFHTVVADRMLGLEGSLAVEFRDPPVSFDLGPGERCEVRPLRVHRVVNRASTTARYLLVQGVGRYDFNVAATPPPQE